MIQTLTIIGIIVAGVVSLAILFCLVMILQYIFWFYWKDCSHCGHKMVYMGRREEKDASYFLYHCPKCSRWEKISSRELFNKAKDETETTTD